MVFGALFLTAVRACTSCPIRHHHTVFRTDFSRRTFGCSNDVSDLSLENVRSTAERNGL